MALFVLGLKQSAGAAILQSPYYTFGRAAARMICNKSKSITSPWLLLPPGSQGVYNFYNLSKKRIERGVKSDYDDAVLVGSSHGWLAFFNRLTNHLFLSNPLSGRRIPLPPIHTLPDPEINLRHGCGTVSKLILSCSPDQDHECRAMISFGPGDRLAFCSLPDQCWTPIGGLFFETFGDLVTHGRAYEDFVYLTKRKLFSCITQFCMYLDPWVPCAPSEMEDWDLSDPASPRSRICYWLSLLSFQGQNCSWLNENKKLLQSCIQIPYLVFADQLFIVTRFVCKSQPYKTVGFCVLEVVYSQNGLVVDKLRLAHSLDGLAMFVGINHSIAVRADEFGLNPNCVYFTDVAHTRLTPSAFTYDIGIFDYENKAFSSCPFNFSHDQTSVTGVVPLPPPVWFTPSWHD